VVEAAILRAWLEAIIKKVEVQAAAVQAARLLLEEEESNAAALEQTATAARQRVPSSFSSSLPPLRPKKTWSSPDFTFRRPQCSTSASW
jgi:hypothetical protein